MAIKICLDAGHYGKYNRSPVIPQYYESDMVWKLHLMLKEELEKYGFEVITTRLLQANDLGLVARGQLSKGCDLFISLHSNAVGSSGNESIDYPVAYALVDDNTTTIDEKSKEIGNILAKVVETTMKTNQKARVNTRKAESDRNGDGIKNDNYYGVLHGARIVNTPGVILEHSFHTNTKATKWLLNDNNLRQLAINEAKVLSDYFGQVKTTNTNPMNYTKEQFIEEIAKNVNKIRGEFGIEVVSPIVAQACLESGYGTSNKAKFYNFFGLKYRENRVKCHSGYFNDSSSEQLENGQYIPISTDWYAFDNFENAVRGYMEFINIDRYKNLKGIKDPKKYLELIREDGYATSLDYVTNVYNVICKWDLTKYDPKEEVKEQPKNDKYYRVRKDWNDPKSQIGAYSILSNAKAACKDGYKVYDWNGNVVYPEPKVEQKPTINTNEYTTGMYKVIVDSLNIRKGPGTNYGINRAINDKGTYTIVEVQNGHWGRLKSGAGWISIHKNYCKKVK